MAMRFADTLKLAITDVVAHPLRSFLTLLGMIIGMITERHASDLMPKIRRIFSAYGEVG